MAELPYVQKVIGTGGMATAIPPIQMQPEQSPLLQNADPDTVPGAVTKRNGYDEEHNIVSGMVASGVGIESIYDYVQEDRDVFRMIHVQDRIYDVVSATVTERFQNASLSSLDFVDYATFKDLCIMVSQGITPQKWNGTDATTSALGGTPATRVHYVEVWKNRVWLANQETSNNKSQVFWSAVNTAEDWSTANDAGNMYIGRDDGDEITGLAAIGDIMIVFKQFSTYAIGGDGFSTFRHWKISPNIGCISPRSIAKSDKFAIFLSHEGVYIVSESGGLHSVGLPVYDRFQQDIRTLLDTVPDPQKRLCGAGIARNNYFISIHEAATEATTTTTAMHVFNYAQGVWRYYTGFNPKCFFRRANGDLLFGHFTDKKVYRHYLWGDTAKDDNGTAITFIAESAEYDFGNFASDKHFMTGFLCCRKIGSLTLTVEVYLDGKLNATTYTVSTGSGSATDREITSPSFNLTGGSNNGRSLRYRVSNSASGTNTIEIYGVGMIYDEERMLA